MTKYKLSIRQEVFNYMNKFPHTSNKDIALKFDTYNENSVKAYRIQWLKNNKEKSGKTDEISPEDQDKLGELIEKVVYTKIDEETIESILLELANKKGSKDAGLARCMIDYYIKIKGKTQTISDTIDMEALREIGVNIKSSD